MSPRTAVFVVLLSAALAGCTEKRYVCRACLSADPTVCAQSDDLPSNKEENARCDAADELCSAMDPKSFARICKNKKRDVMFGCAPEVLAEMRFECTATDHIHIPLLLDL